MQNYFEEFLQQILHGYNHKERSSLRFLLPAHRDFFLRIFPLDKGVDPESINNVIIYVKDLMNSCFNEIDIIDKHF